MIFVVAGGLLVFGRMGLEIDANSRTYRQWYGLLTLTKETTGSLDEFDEITIDREVRTRSSKRGSRTYTVYPIRLTGAPKKLDIEASQDQSAARKEAEQVAKALGLPLADRTGSKKIVRDADHLDESLRQRRRRTGKGPGDIPRCLKA